MINQPLAPDVPQQSMPVCYVRITNKDRNGFIEFDFSVGDPQLYVELILPPSAFEEFCQVNAPQFITKAQADAIDADRIKWREGVPATSTT